MVYFKISIDTRKVSNYMKKLPGKLNRNLSKRANTSIEEFISLSKDLAPKDTGKLSRGIMIGKAKNTKYKINRSVIWHELNPRRKKSFAKYRQWKNFINWMHESNYALHDFHWKTGQPNFFDIAEQIIRRRTFKGMSTAANKAIR